MTRTWSNVITVFLEHCDDKGTDHCEGNGMEPCHERFQGAYRQQVSGSILMLTVLSIVMTKVMKHCDEKTMDNCDGECQWAL